MRSILKIGDKKIVVDHPEHTDLVVEGNKLKTTSKFREELQQEGVQWGDAIAWATKKLGMVQCAPCVKRQTILNNLKQLGVKEVAKQILATLKKDS